MAKPLPLPPEIVKKENGRYYRNCPQCGQESSYLRRNYAIESLRRGKRCKKCTGPENKPAGYYEKIRLSWYKAKQKDGLLRGYEWQLTPELLWQRYLDQESKCALTRIKLVWYDGENKYYNCSIDRINSDVGYTPSNIQLIHKDLNFMKQQYSQNYFIHMCKLVAK